MALINGKLMDEEAHLAALDFSLEELDIPSPMARGPP